MMFKCRNCGFTTSKPILRCPQCNSLLEAEHKFSWMIDNREKGIWIFKSILPEIKIRNSLGEGFTPLIESVFIGKKTGIEKLYFKDEGRNPTGSFRDRVAALITSHAKLEGYRKIVCATDGNTGASLAAYAARLGIKVITYVPRNADYSKIMFMKSFGAEVVEKGESLEDVYSFVNQYVLNNPSLYNGTSESNPLSIEALKTIAYELALDLINIDKVLLPVGSGLTLYSLYKGFKELHENNVIKKIPKLIGIVHCSNRGILEEYGLSESVCKEKPVIGLSYTNPPFLREVIESVKETKGLIVPVTSTEIFKAGELIARYEGLFIEPSAASAIAGLLKISRQLDGSGNVVVLLTGHGLKGYEQYHGLKKREKTRVFYRDTKTEIIKLLMEKEGLHGYAIWKNLKIKVSLQAIYQHLHELEDKGIIYSRIVEGKRVYYLSLKGKRIAELLSEIESLLSI